MPRQCFPIVQHAVLRFLCPKQEPTYLDTKAECGLCPALSTRYHCDIIQAQEQLTASSGLSTLHPHTFTCWSCSSDCSTAWAPFPFLFYCSYSFCLLPGFSTLGSTDAQWADSFLSAVLDFLCLETFTEASPPCKISPESRPISTTVFLSLRKTYNSHHSILQTGGLPVLSKHISEPLIMSLLFLVLLPHVESFRHPVISIHTLSPPVLPEH